LHTILGPDAPSAWALLACASMPTKVENLLVYQKALSAAGEISAILRRSSFARELRLREQLGSSSERVASLIAEGAEQSTDRHFAEHCYRSKGSAREVRAQLLVAVQRGHLRDAERLPIDQHYEELGRMLSGLIRRLERENRHR
jgi:four helix bundle protein